MKAIFLFITFMLIINVSNSQIEIEDQSQEPKVEPVSYNGEFMTFGIGMKEDIKAGVVGEQVTLLDVSTSNIYASKSDIDNYKSVSYSLSDEFKNKTYEVIDFEYDYSDILTIKKENSIYYWKVGYTDKYIFNKYLDKIKERFEGKTFIPLHNSSELEVLDGSNHTLKGIDKLKVEKVKFANLGYEYGVVFNINNSFDCIYPNDSYDQPRIFNGEIYESNDNYIAIASKNKYKPTVILIEENEFTKFNDRNKQFIDKIRDRKAQTGMTEKQCRWAWGMPTSSKENIAGYDVVLIYGDVSSGQILYFINYKLELIK